MPTEIEVPIDFDFDAPSSLYQIIPKTITQTFRSLLNTKHLYQSVEIAERSVRQAIAKAVLSYQKSSSLVINRPEHEEKAFKPLLSDWLPMWIPAPGPIQAPPMGYPRDVTVFELPTVETFCELCKKDQPFNPRPMQTGQLFPHEPSGKPQQQVFALAYICQGCKKFELSFMVTRLGVKLILSGRSVMEEVHVPSYVDRAVARFYSGAVIAYNCNQVLAALFMLRTLIEQYMRFTLAPATFETADKLCDGYNASLDVSFKGIFPSLPGIYSRLSDALHEAREDEDLFDSQIKEIEKHFRAKRSWKEDRRA
jgi:hypothetical protein